MILEETYHFEIVIWLCIIIVGGVIELNIQDIWQGPARYKDIASYVRSPFALFFFLAMNLDFFFFFFSDIAFQCENAAHHLRNISHPIIPSLQN